MPIKRVVIEIEFSIEREHFAFRCYDQRIDFHHRAIASDEGAVKSIEQFRRGFRLWQLELELLCELARLERLQTGEWIDTFANDFLR